MGDETPSSPMGNIPPWVWAILLLGGGSGVGTLTGLEMGGGDHEQCEELERRVDEAEAAREAMASSISALTDVIRQCSPGN